MNQFFKSDPYKILFAFGLLFSLIGVSMWTFFYFGIIDFYPAKLHSQLMVLGFLLSYVSGFLMTAIPRMTGTHFASSAEKIFASLLFFGLFVSVLLNMPAVGYFFGLSTFAFLFVFFIRRKMSMAQKALPSGFMFVPMGIGAGLLGTVLILLSEFGITQGLVLGKLLLYEAFVLNLIIAFGSRLIPMLTKKVGAITPLEVREISHRILITEAAYFNLSFLVEALLDQQAGYLIRGLVFVFVVVRNFKAFVPMIEKTKLAVAINLIVFIFPTGYLALFLFPGYRIHLIHMLYIGGMALLTILISTRVTIAHGGGSFDFERDSRSIYGFTGLILSAMLVRVFGPLLLNVNAVAIFTAASVLFACGIAVWIFNLGDLIFTNKMSVDKC